MWGEAPSAKVGSVGAVPMAAQDDRRKADEMQKWEYMVVPVEAAGKLKKKSSGVSPDVLNELGAEGWEAVGITLKRGDLVAWPVALLKRPLAA